MNRNLFSTYCSEFTSRCCTWLLLSQLLVYLIDSHYANVSQQYFIVGASLSLIYLSTIIGGLIRDKLLTEIQTLLFGLCLLIASSLILLTSSNMYLGLSLVFLASGIITTATPLLIHQFIVNT